MCNYPLGCSDFASKGSDRRSAHQIKKGEGKIKKKAVTKALADRLRRDREANRIAQENEAAKSAKASVMAAHRATWNARIDAVVSQVLAFRVTHPDPRADSKRFVNCVVGLKRVAVFERRGGTLSVGRITTHSGVGGALNC